VKPRAKEILSDLFFAALVLLALIGIGWAAGWLG